MNIPPIFPSDQNPQPHSSQWPQPAARKQIIQNAPGTWSVHTALNVIRTVLPTSALNYNALKGISVAYLPKEARDIIAYLRANPNVFNTVAALSSQYAEELPNWTAQVQLQELPVKQAPRKTLDLYPAFAQQTPDSIQTVLQAIQKYLPSAEPLPHLQQAAPSEPNTAPKQEPTISPAMADAFKAVLKEPVTPAVLLQRIEALAQSKQMSPDFIQLLTGMLWNAQLHRSKSIQSGDTFERKTEEPTEEKMMPVDAVLETEDSLMSAMHEPHDPTVQAFQRIELSAQQIRDLCRHLKSSGGITLEEFQNYQPANKEEEELLRYFRQYNIFHAIADLNGKDETLDPSDIRIALADHTLVLNDAHITLVFNP